MRNLVFFADGTWNDTRNPKKLTNVHFLHQMSQTSKDADSPQLTKYQTGVGTSGPLSARVGGFAFGKGLDDKIMEAYVWLAANYRPSDHIFLFGFSRGAYTVRSLVGMIKKAGLLNFFGTGLSAQERHALVNAAFSKYRDRGVDVTGLSDAPKHPLPKIRFLGCWDTVGSLGIPDDLGLLASNKNANKYDFIDTRLWENVEIARHAVAIDEMRRTYTPALWDEIKEPRHPNMQQKWFSGVHSNIGGGYEVRDLSDVSLKWMMEEAVAAGLLCQTNEHQPISPQPLGKLEDSYSGIFRKMKSRPRSVPSFLADDASDRFSDAALLRFKANQGYWPTTHLAPGDSISLSVSAKEHWGRTNLFLETGATYEFTATGTWVNWMARHGPEGEAKEHRGRWHQMGDSYDKRTRDRLGDTYYPSTYSPARRFRDAPWIALVGVIANGEGVDPNTKEIIEHESFLIGAHKIHPVTKEGYLYCYANDAWRFYGNNKGQISLKVVRTA